VSVDDVIVVVVVVMAKCKTTKEKSCMIAIEDDDASLAAFDFYAEHLHKEGNKIVLVHVVETSVRSSNQSTIHLNTAREQKMMEEKQKVKIIQDVYEERMRHCGIPGRINVIYYSQQPGKVLCEVAKEDKCAMIVVGTPLGSMLASPQDHSMGNVIDYLLKKSLCPVVVVRHEALVDHSVQRFMVSPDRRMSVAAVQQTREQRLRKISCPVMTSSSPPRYDLLGLGAGDHSPSHGKSFERLTIAEKVTQKPRRHSNIINPFLQLKLKSGKHLPETLKEDETEEEDS